jgi:hypothetical protein
MFAAPVIIEFYLAGFICFVSARAVTAAERTVEPTRMIEQRRAKGGVLADGMAA